MMKLSNKKINTEERDKHTNVISHKNFKMILRFGFYADAISWILKHFS